jgi:hypothetical protein
MFGGIPSIKSRDKSNKNKDQKLTTTQDPSLSIDICFSANNVNVVDRGWEACTNLVRCKHRSKVSSRPGACMPSDDLFPTSLGSDEGLHPGLDAAVDAYQIQTNIVAALILGIAVCLETICCGGR